MPRYFFLGARHSISTCTGDVPKNIQSIRGTHNQREKSCSVTTQRFPRVFSNQVTLLWHRKSSLKWVVGHVWYFLTHLQDGLQLTYKRIYSKPCDLGKRLVTNRQPAWKQSQKLHIRRSRYSRNSIFFDQDNKSQRFCFNLSDADEVFSAICGWYREIKCLRNPTLSMRSGTYFEG